MHLRLFKFLMKTLPQSEVLSRLYYGSVGEFYILFTPEKISSIAETLASVTWIKFGRNYDFSENSSNADSWFRMPFYKQTPPHWSVTTSIRLITVMLLPWFSFEKSELFSPYLFAKETQARHLHPSTQTKLLDPQINWVTYINISESNSSDHSRRMMLLLFYIVDSLYIVF